MTSESRATPARCNGQAESSELSAELFGIPESRQQSQSPKQAQYQPEIRQERARRDILRSSRVIPCQPRAHDHTSVSIG